MPDQKDASQQGAEVDPPAADPRGPGAADDDGLESRPGQGENQAGFLKDVPAPGSGRS